MEHCCRVGRRFGNVLQIFKRRKRTRYRESKPVGGKEKKTEHGGRKEEKREDSLAENPQGIEMIVQKAETVFLRTERAIGKVLGHTGTALVSGQKRRWSEKGDADKARDEKLSKKKLHIGSIAPASQK